MDSFAFSPIGHVRAERREKRLVPRQPGELGEALTIELAPRDGIDDALCDLDGFDHIWVVFVFHEAKHYAPKVLPPRSQKKRGVLATRSPHRPNPIGLSVVHLVRIEGRTLFIEGADMLDGTPVLDVKPYIAYADAIPAAKLGWLKEEGERVRAEQEGRPVDPIPRWRVSWSAPATEAVLWLKTRAIDIAEGVENSLSLGPEPHAYRRIKKRGDALELSVKEWRIDFRVAGAEVVVERVRSGYRPQEIYRGGGATRIHQAFVEAFGS